MSQTTRITRRGAMSVLVSLAMIAAVVFIQKAEQPDVSNAFAPSIKVKGTVGTPVHLREGDLTLSHVRVAKSLQTSGFSKKHLTTSGIWLLIGYRFFPKRKSESMDVALYTRDRTKYDASGRTGSTVTSDTIYGNPGFTKKGVIAFELPPDAIAGSVVVVGNGGLFGSPLWDTQAVVSLGVDDQRAASLVSNAPDAVNVGQ